MTSHVEIMVEEPSMEAALAEIVPKIAKGLSFSIYNYQCKRELLDRLPDRLRGYATWLPNDWQILVIVDRDGDSCLELKTELEEFAANARLRTPSRAGHLGTQVVNRLAVEELEAWFFGDWEAVLAAYPKVDPKIPNKQAFRDPDGIAGGTWEALERVLRKAGYFKTGIRKIETAKAVARTMQPERNRSKSFQVFRQTLLQMISAPAMNQTQQSATRH